MVGIDYSFAPHMISLHFSLSSWSRLALSVLLWLLGMLTLLSLANSFFFVSAVLIAFGKYYFWLVLGGLLVSLVVPVAPRTRWVGMVTLGILLVMVGPYLWRAVRPQTMAGLRIITLNVSESTEAYDGLIELINAERADVFFIQELRADLVARIEAEVSSDYAYRYFEPSRFTLGLGFVSRLPLENARTVAHEGEGFKRQYLEVEVTQGGDTYTLLNIHTLPPTRPSWFESRNREIEVYKQRVTEGSRVIVAGDFNTVPWSRPVGSREAAYGVSSVESGSAGTWQLFGFPLVRVPLDYALYSPDLALVETAVLSDIGSDHLPVIVELAPRIGD